MRRISKNSDIALDLSTVRGASGRFVLYLYTVAPETSRIKRTDAQAVTDEESGKRTLPLNWTELSTLDSGVLNYTCNALSDDADYDDGVYNATYSGSTIYYIDNGEGGGEASLQEQIDDLDIRLTDNEALDVRQGEDITALDGRVTYLEEHPYDDTEIRGEIAAKQDALVSGTNIKTVNGQSLLGSGDIDTSEAFVVTMTKSGTSCTADKSVDEIWRAYYRDKKAVIAVVPDHAGSGEYLLTACDPDADQYWFSSFQSNSCEVIAWNADTDYSYTISEKTFAEYSQLAAKQDALVSGTNIKTINNESILGSGNVTVVTGVTWDGNNTVNNSGVAVLHTPRASDISGPFTVNNARKDNVSDAIVALNTYCGQKQDTLTFDSAPTQNSDNPVKSGGVYTAISDEATTRGNADSALDTRLDVVETPLTVYVDTPEHPAPGDSEIITFEDQAFGAALASAFGSGGQLTYGQARAVTSISYTDGIAWSGGEGHYTSMSELKHFTNLATIGIEALMPGFEDNLVIEIPEGVTSIDDYAFCTMTTDTVVDNRSIYCRAATPPAFVGQDPETIFGPPLESPEHATPLEGGVVLRIYVPEESVDAYKAATGWSYYADYIQAMPDEGTTYSKWQDACDDLFTMADDSVTDIGSLDARVTALENAVPPTYDDTEIRQVTSEALTELRSIIYDNEDVTAASLTSLRALIDTLSTSLTALAARVTQAETDITTLDTVMSAAVNQLS